ncbi:hypothetical protein [Nonomuraea sp. SYSU D8015]|uniref:hypothetical protein n=1 Tax=Nonomuraea sp. SYSU D8015 TaxID=2593644 RepID=UPI0016610AC1|nr:hypothetical protein [Nonomuraea sp. SYSU D8015]
MKVVILIPASVHTATLAIPLALRHRLPEPVATHFTDETPDRSSHLWAAVGENLMLGTGAWSVLGLLALLRHDGSMGRRIAAGLALGIVVLLDVALLLGVVVSNLDAASWQEASSPSYAPTVAVGSGVLAMLFGAIAVSPRRPQPEEREEIPDDPVTDPPARGRTVWIGRARNPAYFWRTLAATCLMLVLAALGVSWMLAAAVVPLASLHFWSGVTAVFDGCRLTVRGGVPFLFPRRITLEQIETAERVEIDPRQWGWGWRLRKRRKHAVVVRRGEALLVALRGGGEFIVTVDDAAVGAAEIRQALRCAKLELPPEPQPTSAQEE